MNQLDVNEKKSDKDAHDVTEADVKAESPAAAMAADVKNEKKVLGTY